MATVSAIQNAVIVVQVEVPAGVPAASQKATQALRQAEEAFACLRSRTSSPTSTELGECRRIVAAAFLDAAQAWENARPAAALAAAYRRTAARLHPAPGPSFGRVSRNAA